MSDPWRQTADLNFSPPKQEKQKLESQGPQIQDRQKCLKAKGKPNNQKRPKRKPKAASNYHEEAIKMMNIIIELQKEQNEFLKVIQQKLTMTFDRKLDGNFNRGSGMRRAARSGDNKETQSLNSRNSTEDNSEGI